VLPGEARQPFWFVVREKQGELRSPCPDEDIWTCVACGDQKMPAPWRAGTVYAKA